MKVSREIILIAACLFSGLSIIIGNLISEKIIRLVVQGGLLSISIVLYVILYKSLPKDKQK